MGVFYRSLDCEQISELKSILIGDKNARPKILSHPAEMLS